MDNLWRAGYEYAQRHMDGRIRGNEAGRHASPAVESWLDDEFARELIKHVGPAVRVGPGFTVETLLGAYALDLRVEHHNLSVGFVYDGLRDDAGFTGLWLDAALIGTNAVRVIYRLRRCDIESHLHDILYAVSRADGRLCSERGRVNLERLASETMRAYRLPREHIEVRYPKVRDEEMDVDPSGDPEDTPVEPHLGESGDCLHMVRREHASLLSWYRLARSRGVRSVEQAMEMLKAENLRGPDESP